jgi:hypothetical protein
MLYSNIFLIVLNWYLLTLYCMFRENLFIKLAFVFINHVFLKMSNVEVQTQETKMNTASISRDSPAFHFCLPLSRPHFVKTCFLPHFYFYLPICHISYPAHINSS